MPASGFARLPRVEQPKRRTFRELKNRPETTGSLPICGGSEIAQDSPEEASKFFDQVLQSGMWRWGQREKNRKENQSLIREFVRLRNKYPKQFEEAWVKIVEKEVERLKTNGLFRVGDDRRLRDLFLGHAHRAKKSRT